MNRTKKFFYNSATSAFMQVITMVAGFITPMVMLQSYGSEINGLIISISQFIAYFNLVEAGLAGASIYALYKPLADNDHKAINSVVSAANKFYTQSGYIFISLTIGFAFIYPVFVQTDYLTPFRVGLLVLILGVNGALEFFTLAKYRVLLSADQKDYVISLASTVAIIVNTIMIVVLAHFEVNIVILRAVALLSIFLRSFILMIYAKSKYKYINYKETPNDNALNKRWDVLYLQVLGSVHASTPVVLATIFTDLKMVSVYSIFNMVIGGIGGIVGIFASGLSASFGDVIVKKEQFVLQRTYKEFEFAYYSLIAILYSTAMVTIMPFIRIYTKGITDANYDLPLIGFLFVLNGFLFNLKTPQGMLVISAGMYKETKWQTTLQGIIAVLGGIVLAPFFGLAGILAGSILANIFRDIDLLFFIPHRVTKLRVRDTAYRFIQAFVSIAIVCLPFIYINTAPENYLDWIIFAAVVGIYAVVVVGGMGLIFEREEFRNVTLRILSMIGVKK